MSCVASKAGTVGHAHPAKELYDVLQVVLVYMNTLH